MGKQLSASPFAFVSFVCTILSGTAQIAGAQIVDIAAEAQASRDQLAAEISAVDAATLREKLLSSADNERLAHWYAGEVLIGDRWLTLDEAQQRAANDKKLDTYVALRNKAADRGSDHERLARWCAKCNLSDLAIMHWLHVLRFDSNHRSALRELDLTWHAGSLMTNAEAKQYTIREREWDKQKKQWQARIKRLRRELEKGEPAQQVAARQALREVHEPAAVPALLEEFGEQAADEEKTVDRRRELIAVLGGIDSPDAVETLAQLAVESPNESVSYAAMDQLKSKPIETSAPILLTKLAQPVEASVSINQIGHQIVSHYSYSQETPAGEYESYEKSSYAIPGRRYISRQSYLNLGPGTRGTQYRCGRPPITRIEIATPSGSPISNIEAPEYRTNRASTLRYMRSQAEGVEKQLAHANAERLQRNARVANVLTELTGETLPPSPKSWWNWWGEFLDRHPDVAGQGARQRLNAALMSRSERGLAKGTWVWTQRGKRPVEDVFPGDYALAQDPQTGELAYKVVMAIGAPRQLTVAKVEVVESDLFCAPGHIVWSTGSGWQRVSNLKAGQSIHGATTEARVASVGESFEIDCYDLIVDGFHTLFVGEHGVLVHDATPIAPAHVALPGFSPTAVADAVKLAGVAR